MDLIFCFCFFFFCFLHQCFFPTSELWSPMSPPDPRLILKVTAGQFVYSAVMCHGMWPHPISPNIKGIVRLYKVILLF